MNQEPENLESEVKIHVTPKCLSMIPVEDIKPHPKNANKHSDKQILRLVEIIRYQGFRVPLIVSNHSGLLVKGHGSLEAAKLLKMPKVPVLFQNYESDEQEYAALISDNEIARWSQLDLDSIQLEVPKLTLNLDLLGIDRLKINATNESSPEDEEVPEVKENPVTRKGDLWTLGRHKLLCGDSGDARNISRLMGDQTADLVFTDPPYRMAVEGGSSQPIGKAARKLGEMIKHLCDFDPMKFLDSLPSVFRRNTMNAYVFCNKDLVPDYLNWAVKNGYSFNILFWKKPNAIPLGGSHRPDVEYLLLFRKGAIWNNGVSGANYSKCLEYGRELSKDHPTMKPVALIVNELLISSNEDSVVVEFFTGSGSTIIACEKTNRSCFGMELDERYCDVIIKRWELFSGKKAVHSSGKNYDQMRVERKKKVAPVKKRKK